MAVEVKIDAQQLAALGTRTEVAFAKAILRAAQYLTGVIRKEVRDTFPGGRTGGLSRSFRETFFGQDGSVTSAGSYSSLVYARIQDEGGTITPKSGRNLAVPIRGRVPLGKWPRHYGANELVLIKRKGRNSLLAQVSGKGKSQRVRVLYVLKPRVVLRGRHYLDAASRKAEPGIAETLASAISDAAGGTGGQP